MTRRVPKTMHHTGSLKSLEAVLEAKGFKEAPRDHSIYSEGPSITFVSLGRKKTKGKQVTQENSGNTTISDKKD